MTDQPEERPLTTARKDIDAKAQVLAPLTFSEIENIAFVLTAVPNARVPAPMGEPFELFLKRLHAAVLRYIADVEAHVEIDGQPSARDRGINFLRAVAETPLNALISEQANSPGPENLMRVVLYWAADVRLAGYSRAHDPAARVSAAQAAAADLHEWERRKRGEHDRANTRDGRPLFDFLAHIHGAARELGVPRALPSNETLSSIDPDDEMPAASTPLLALILACRDLATSRAALYFDRPAQSCRRAALELIDWNSGKPARQIVDILRKVRRKSPNFVDFGA